MENSIKAKITLGALIFFALWVFMALLVSNVAAEHNVATEENEGPISMCPVTKMSGKIYECKTCHMMRVDENGKLFFGLKPVEPYAHYNASTPSHTTVMESDGKTVVWNFITSIGTAYDVKALYDWLSWHPELKHIVFDIQSPGGSLFGAERIVGLMNELKTKGYIVETRCYGFAASAGFYIFVNGTKGYRFATEYAELMWHELITFSLFSIEGPSDKEDQARVLRHLQDGRNQRIADVTGMTKEEVDEQIKKKELWLYGTQAVEMGVADGLLDR